MIMAPIEDLPKENATIENSSLTVKQDIEVDQTTLGSRSNGGPMAKSKSHEDVKQHSLQSSSSEWQQSPTESSLEERTQNKDQPTNGQDGIITQDDDHLERELRLGESVHATTFPQAMETLLVEVSELQDTRASEDGDISEGSLQKKGLPQMSGDSAHTEEYKEAQMTMPISVISHDLTNEKEMSETLHKLDEGDQPPPSGSESLQYEHGENDHELGVHDHDMKHLDTHGEWENTPEIPLSHHDASQPSEEQVSLSEVMEENVTGVNEPAASISALLNEARPPARSTTPQPVHDMSGPESESKAEEKAVKKLSPPSIIVQMTAKFNITLDAHDDSDLHQDVKHSNASKKYPMDDLPQNHPPIIDTPKSPHASTQEPKKTVKSGSSKAHSVDQGGGSDTLSMQLLPHEATSSTETTPTQQPPSQTPKLHSSSLTLEQESPSITPELESSPVTPEQQSPLTPKLQSSSLTPQHQSSSKSMSSPLSDNTSTQRTIESTKIVPEDEEEADQPQDQTMMVLLPPKPDELPASPTRTSTKEQGITASMPLLRSKSPPANVSTTPQSQTSVTQSVNILTRGVLSSTVKTLNEDFVRNQPMPFNTTQHVAGKIMGYHLCLSLKYILQMK